MQCRGTDDAGLVMTFSMMPPADELVAILAAIEAVRHRFGDESAYGWRCASPMTDDQIEAALEEFQEAEAALVAEVQQEAPEAPRLWTKAEIQSIMWEMQRQHYSTARASGYGGGLRHF